MLPNTNFSDLISCVGFNYFHANLLCKLSKQVNHACIGLKKQNKINKKRRNADMKQDSICIAIEVSDQKSKGKVAHNKLIRYRKVVSET